MKTALNHLFLFFLVLGLPVRSIAQLCDGKPGIVEYSESFGFGNNPGPPLPAGSTIYTYGGIWPGHYMVVNDAGQNGNLWHSGPDHNGGSTNGYMLLFDAHPAYDTLYQTTIPIQCEATDYEFSLWVANIVKPFECAGASIEPNLRFQVVAAPGGTLLGETGTGPIPTSNTLTWVPVGITCVVPAGVNQVYFRILNDAPDGCGNDLVIDDLLVRPCIPFRYQLTTVCWGDSVIVGDSVYYNSGLYTNYFDIPSNCHDSLVATQLMVAGEPLAQSFTICEGDSIKIGDHVYRHSGVYTDTVTFQPCDLHYITTLQVQNGAPHVQSVNLCPGDTLFVGNSAHAQTGIYTDSLTSAAGCDSIVISEVILTPLWVEIQPDSALLELGKTIRLEGTAGPSPPLHWQWEPSAAADCDTCPAVVLQPASSGYYTLYVVSSDDCTAADSIFITIEPCAKIFIPNVFTPDDDGYNDFFTVYGADCVPEISLLQVFDRWGNLVFNAGPHAPNSEKDGWDGRANGKICPSGVYVYRAIIVLLDGSRKERSGTINLMR